MASERDALRRALRRLGHVAPEVLEVSRQRVRGNLRTRLRAAAPLPQPDSTPADLTVLHRPFYIGGTMLLVCLVITGGVMVRSMLERKPASTLQAKSAPVLTAESPTPAPSPQSGMKASPAPAPALPNPNRTPPSGAATQPRASGPPARAVRPPVRFTLLPPGEGKVILDRACGTCHRAASVGAYHYATRTQYAEVVARMISMGAQVSEQEAPVLTDYLFDNLAAKSVPEADPAGREILERACTGCHSLNGIENYSYDSEDSYRELVSTMVSYGATLSDAEKTTLIRFLFTTYGKH